MSLIQCLRGKPWPRAARTIVTAVLVTGCASLCSADALRVSFGQVDVVNRSYPTACAEEDNVDLEFKNPNIAGFTVIAAHPAYIERISAELSKPDFHGCPFGNDPVVPGPKPAPPQKVIFFQTPEVRLVGFRLPTFWRPANVPVIVGARHELGLQLVQLWVKSASGGWEEIVAFYPPDGYWRLRPLPYGKMRLGSYGSSLLIGPVARDAKRPYVAIRQVLYVPQSRSFRLDFAAGGSATLKLALTGPQKCALSVVFAGAFPKDRPFAALRSMFVDERHSDAAMIASDGGKPEETILAFRNRKVSSLWIGRPMLSLHNNTAPDHWIGDFILKTAAH